jgi:hypothetical protein
MTGRSVENGEPWTSPYPLLKGEEKTKKPFHYPKFKTQFLNPGGNHDEFTSISTESGPK